MMVNKTAKWIKLDEIVADYLDQSGQTQSQYRRMWNIAYRGMEDMGMDLFYEPKTLRIDVNENKTFDLPSDYFKWIKVGVLNEDGEVATLKRNTNLTRYAMERTDRINKVQDAQTTAVYDITRPYYANFFYEGNRYDALYGLPSGAELIGMFDISEREGLGLLDVDFPHSYIILEYLCVPTMEEEFRIPIEAKEALINWCAWKDIQFLANGRKVTLGDKQMREKAYFNSKRLAAGRIKPIRMMEINDVINDSVRFSLKA